MAHSPGDRLGHYVISEPLGAGGMGEVHRAQDTRLGRDVALKILPEVFGDDPERLARFDREAKVLASVNHPNVATLYGLEILESSTETEGAAGTVALVMELVEGEDLAERVARGPIPLKGAIQIARQIAKGLEAAHAKGVVHRDLKPGNIRITSDGTVKILDFGLAKEWQPGPGDLDFTESPTITAEMTREGTILGTASYLSPEQARGQAVDRRTDIWAFGCVLYEMITGQRAFPGNTSTEIIARVLEREPDWSALSPSVAPALRRLLGRCVEKDPNRRLRDAGDVGLELEDLELEEPTVPTAGRPSATNPIVSFAPWLVAAAAVILTAITWFGKPSPAHPGMSTPLRFTERSPAPLDIARNNHSGSMVAISPDGNLLVWVAAVGDSTQLYARHLEEERAHPVSGTEGAQGPFFSPDGEWIGFWAGGKLKKVAVRGGVPLTICEIAHVHGPCWGDGIIVMGAIGDGSLWRVDPGGGEAQRIEISNRPGFQGDYPKLLPGSEYMMVSTQGQPSVALVSLDTGVVTILIEEGSSATYLPSGHLVWTQEDSLLAAPFDLPSRTVTGEARTVIEGILTESHVGAFSHYAVSDDGTIAYLPGTFERGGARPVWVELDGSVEPLPLPADAYLSPRISPDGEELLFSRQGTTRSIWLAEPGRGMVTPVTGDEGHDYWAIWVPDGSHIVFNSQRGNEPSNLWMQPVDHSGPPTRLTVAPFHQPPMDITRDGGTVLFAAAIATDDDIDVFLLHVGSEQSPTPLLTSDADEVQPALSPDDRWLAYASNVTGSYEVYVQPFPNLGATVRVSPNGGYEPLWSPDGRRLYYRSVSGRKIFAVDVVNSDPLQVGRERLLFEGDFAPGVRWGAKWDIHPDGEKFLMLKIEHPEPPEGIRVIANWFTELERLAPSDN